MPVERERKFIITVEARDAALALFAASPQVRILDAYLPPRGGSGPPLRLRCEGPVDGPQPTSAVACVKVPRADGDRDELEWDVPLPLALPSGCVLVGKTRAAIADLSAPGAVVTIDAYTSPQASACPLTGDPLAGPVLVAEVEGGEGDRAAVDAWRPPAGWREVTGRPEFGASAVARRGWPNPSAAPAV